MQAPRGPILASEALARRAVTRAELRRDYVGIYPGVWVPRESQRTARQRAYAAWLWSRRRGVLAGVSASAMLGAKWIDGDAPAELVHSNRRAPPLLTVHTDTLLPGEVQMVRGLPVTTAARTAFDLGRRLPTTEGVQRVDALMNATDLKVVDIAAVADAHRGARGLRQLDTTLRLVDDRSESPYESLTRLRLVQAGFPLPQTQIPVYDAQGNVGARIDMGWEEYLVGADFEGAHHWLDPKQRERDAERYNFIAEAGWIDIRLTSRTLHLRPEVFLERVGAALISRGCPKTW
ncbi:hypothetical protein [Mycolicibacter senuensis]|uniref:DUF559 domain-containing protein n=1 Tax=Mycolicibacter senuensis TaxID=386913 RepID=A0A7I9XFP0_9MYCO|nr:hypothetical protein [Mycolicibacter senuensis]ORW68272.1 hypothetical protein AWC24_08675 [Mycolicibacter senuensis]GFG68340.1 hypothetical protein MSEN_00600 [Mycolicibacter senuensis]